MSRQTAHGIAGVCLFIGFSLGLVPLFQWFALDHASGPIGLLFRHPADPWVWVIPAGIAAACTAGLFYFGSRGDQAARLRSDHGA